MNIKKKTLYLIRYILFKSQLPHALQGSEGSNPSLCHTLLDHPEIKKTTTKTL